MRGKPLREIRFQPEYREKPDPPKRSWCNENAMAMNTYLSFRQKLLDTPTMEHWNLASGEMAARGN